MKSITAAAAFAAAALAALQPADAQDFMEVYLTGVQVVQTRSNGEDPYIVAYGVAESGGPIYPVFIPGENQPWQNVSVGDVIPLNVLVWRGPAQDVQLQAHVYHYDTGTRDFVAGFTSVTTKISAALIAYGTGGLGAGAGFVVAQGGEWAANRVRETSGDSVPLGEASMLLELRRAGALADRPQNEHLGIWYDFYTEHNWNGALYGLFWEVRRR